MARIVCIDYDAGMDVPFALFLANTGLPMLFPQVTGMTVALLPVIIVEGGIARLRLPLSSARAFKGVGLANIASTFLGVPVAWVAMFVLNIVTTGTKAHGLDSSLGIFKSVVLQASWLVPYEQDFYWMVPSASLVLLVPSFFVSVFVERLVLLRTWRDVEKGQVVKTAWFVNGISYGILFLLATLWLAFSIKTTGTSGVTFDHGTP